MIRTNTPATCKAILLAYAAGTNTQVPAMLHDILLGDNKNLDFFQTACFSLERHRLLAHLSGIKDRVITCTGLAEAQKIKTTMQLERHNMSLTAQALIKVLAEDCKREVFAWNVAGLPPEAVNAVNLIGEKSI